MLDKLDIENEVGVAGEVVELNKTQVAEDPPRNTSRNKAHYIKM